MLQWRINFLKLNIMYREDFHDHHDKRQVPGGKNVVNEPLSITLLNIVTISDRNNVLNGSRSCGAVTMAFDRINPQRSFSIPSVLPGTLGLHATYKRN